MYNDIDVKLRDICSMVLNEFECRSCVSVCLGNTWNASSEILRIYFVYHSKILDFVVFYGHIVVIFFF